MKTLVILILLGMQAFSLHAQQQKMVAIEGGTYLPLYGSNGDLVQVNDFYLDAFPVTHGDFLKFVNNYPEWRKSQVKGLFADERYLQFWENDFQFPGNLETSPVVQVSWFAAKAYCDCQGKRLPTVDEWEYVAMASSTQKDAREDSLFTLSILSGYEKPKTYLLEVGNQPQNAWGIYDLHGLVWEWTQDFNAIILTGESRNNGNTDLGLFCASGALGANDLMNYAAFMRYAMRSSLKARYSLTNLGFRCASDVAVADY